MADENPVDIADEAIETSGDDFLEENIEVEHKAETEVGITEFLTPGLAPISGIIKHRYSDFKVAEVGLDGKVAEITSHLYDPELMPAVESKPEAEEGIPTAERIREALPSCVLWEDDFIQSLLAMVADGGKVMEGEIEAVTPPIDDKASRTQVHQAIRSLFHGKLASESTTSNNNSIRIYPAKQNNHKLGDKRGRRDDRNTPKQPGQHRYLRFTLYKECMDTIEAIQFLSKRLHLSTKDFSYAGTKDRRGFTSQFLVVRNATVNKVLGINKLTPDAKESSGRVKVSNICLAEGPLKLGDLRGNRFTLVIRQLSTAGDVSQNIESFKENGFINYFGLQRFGTGSVRSHQIGLALLRGEWREAVELILAPREGEKDQRAIEARLMWQKEGTAAASTIQRLFPFRFTAERQVLSHYARDPAANANDHQGAIMSINRELRLMYVHSVQSWIWNKMASERMKRFGKTLIEGDLVIIGDGEEVKAVTAEDISLYSIYQMVLPQPGYKTIYPNNVIGQLYRELLDELKLSHSKAFTTKNKALWDLPGAYRNVFVLPEDVEYSVGYYADPEGDISDLQTESSSEVPHQGLIVSFSLPTSSYATMAMREIMRSTTDPRQHALLTRAHLQK